MSRCFPFPPPGYEKKARPDDAELLEKEKHREKKHKKEKRDKDKREGKENKERERSDGKHREKKDRKEKRRDKRNEKEKDRDKDKDKASTSGEKKVIAQSDGCNEEKLYQKERGHDKGESIIIPHEKKQKQKQKLAVLSQSHNGGKPIQNSLVCQEKMEDCKFVQELGRRIRDEEKKGAGSQLVERSTATTTITTTTGTDLAEGKEKNKDRRRVDREISGQEGINEESRLSGRNAMVLQNLAGVVQNRVEGMKKNSRRMQRKEKTKKNEGDDKRKGKDREKNGQATKDKVREKEKKKEERVKTKSENKNTEQENKSKDSNKNDHMYTHNIETLYITHDSDKNAAAAAAASEGRVRKRKDLEANGTLHDNDVRLNSKMPRPNSSHPSTENGGRKLEPNIHHRVVVVVDNSKVEHKLNGVIEEAHQPSSSAIIAQADDQIAEAPSSKQPHPDTKYLSQVRSVPQMGEEDCSDVVDDQDEWLFNSSKKLNVDSLRYTDKQPPGVVWAEALQISSSDLCALPYVIPY